MAAESSGRATRDRLRGVAAVKLVPASDPALDRFAELVRKVLNVPDARVSLAPAEAEPLVVTDLREHDHVHKDHTIAGYAAMPLTDRDGGVLGSLCAIDHEPRRWTARELDLLADLAVACSDMLRLRVLTRTAENAEAAAEALTRRADAAYDRSQLLLNASVALTGTTTVTDVVDTVSHLVGGALASAYAGVGLLDPESAHLIVRSPGTRPLRLALDADHPFVTAARNGMPQLYADRAAVRAAHPGLSGGPGLREAAAVVPIPGLAGVRGVLCLAWDEHREPEVGELAVLTTLAAYVSQALHRAERLDDRTTAARTLQQALLTEVPPADHLQVVARYQPAHAADEVGGDWYDVIRLPGDRLALVIGDVGGHNIAAAARMSELRSMLRGFIADRDEPPSALLRRLDEANRTLGAWTVATVLVAYLDSGPGPARTLHWANAGHPPPIVTGPDGVVTSPGERDPLLGLGTDMPRASYSMVVPPGATVLLHTDGLVEVRGRSLDEGTARLTAALTEHRHRPLDELADFLLRHTLQVAREDDVALLLVRTPPEVAQSG